MSIVTYQYKRLKDLKVPIITLAIRYGEMWHPVEAYVDTGATYSVFTAQVANRLGLSLSHWTQNLCSSGRWGFIPVYLHDFEIQIGKHRVVVPLGFSGKLGISFNLLGRTGIFEFFKVCFDERDFVVTFTQYELQP